MAKAHTTWKVLPHGPIEKLDENLWRVEGVLASVAMKRVMTIARLATGHLVVHNAIALGKAEMREIDAWGPVAYIIVPNGYHRLDAPAFKERYPTAAVICPRGSRAKVEEVLRVEGTYDDAFVDTNVSLRTLHGVKEAEGVMTVRAAGGVTLVFNDAIFNMPHGHGASGIVLRYLTGSTGGPRISRLFRMLAINDKAALRADLEALAKTQGLRRLVVAHHESVEHDAAATLMRVAATL